MRVRRLSQNGIDTFRQYLESLATDGPSPYPSELLEDDENASEIKPAVDVELRTFGSRIDAAAYLDERFSSASLQGIGICQ